MLKFGLFSKTVVLNNVKQFAGKLAGTGYTPWIMCLILGQSHGNVKKHKSSPATLPAYIVNS